MTKVGKATRLNARDGLLALTLALAVSVPVAAWSQAATGTDEARDADGVYAESGFRLPLPRREAMDPAGQKVFDALTAANNDPRRGNSGPGKGLKGPTGILLHSPRVAQVGQDLNWYLRFEAGLDDRTREVAILTVAREARNAFEWEAHEPIARRVGVPDKVISAIRDRADVTGLEPRDAIIIALGREAITDHKVSRATYEEALAAFGPKRLVDLVSLMGQYLSNAMVLTVFAMQVPPPPAAAK